MITGGKGCIAKGLDKALAKRGYLVIDLGKDEYDITFESNSKYYMKKYQPDILINNAGVIYPGNIVDGSVHDWIETLYVNLVGSYYASRYAIQYGCKKIVNIGSSSSLDARYSGWSAYNVSKAGLVALTRSLHCEGIFSLCISPGRTDTPMRDHTHPDEDKNTRLSVGELASSVLFLLDRIESLSGLEIVVKRSSGGGVLLYNRKCGIDYGVKWIH